MDLSVIIINWNSVNYIKECLTSLYRGIKNLNFEIIVVDNGSYDGCGEFIGKQFPRAQFIQSNDNVGFARANNLGFRYSSGKAVLFLNPDTEIIGTAIENMYSQLVRLPDAGAVGCRLLNSDSSLQTSCVQPFPSILNCILSFEYFRLSIPKLGFWGIRALYESTALPSLVDAISGACIMVRRDVFEKIGLFSSDYFMYSEDIDLCYKIRKYGYKVYYVNSAKIVHHGGGSSTQRGKSSFSVVMMQEATCIFLRKWKGVPYSVLYKLSIGTAACLRLFLLAIIYPLTKSHLRKQAIVVSAKKWHKVLRWTIGLEQWAERLNN